MLDFVPSHTGLDRSREEDRAGYCLTVSDLASRGLYLDLPPWRYHVFEMRRG